jgi:TetR/AcrR family transcriptional regulator
MPSVDQRDTATTVPRPSKRERKKAEKERRILAAALDLFREHGFEDTTTAEIARRAGIGAGTLYLYVGSKEDLLVAVFNEDAGHAWETAFNAADPCAPVVEQLIEVFSAVSDHHEADMRLARAYFKQLSFVGEEASEGVRAFMRTFYGRLTALLEQAQESRRLAPEVPARTLAGNLFAIWFLLMQRRSNGSLSPEEMSAELRSGFEVALWAMTPQGPAC